MTSSTAYSSEYIVRSWYETRARGEYEDFWREHVADGVVYHLPARNPLGGDHRGKEAVRAWLDALDKRSGSTFRIEVRDVALTREGAVALLRVTAERVGRRLDSKQAHVFQIEGGQITHIWEYGYDRYAIDDFWS